MATLQQIFNLKNSTSLRNRVTAACWKAAADIANEDPGTENHANRLTWARQALSSNGTGELVDRMLMAVIQNTTIQASGEQATDDDLQYVVNSHINFFANG